MPALVWFCGTFCSAWVSFSTTFGLRVPLLFNPSFGQPPWPFSPIPPPNRMLYNIHITPSHHNQLVPHRCMTRAQTGLHVCPACRTAKRSTVSPFCTHSNRCCCHLYPDGYQICTIFQDVWQMANPERLPQPRSSSNCLVPNR